MAGSAGPRRGRARLALLLGLCAPAPALAEEPPSAPSAETRAYAEFQQGAEALERGELARAAEHFEAAQALSPNPVVLYDLGQTYSALGLPVRAERALRLYLESAPPESDPARRREVEDLIAFNERRIGVAVLGAVASGVALELDGAPVAVPAGGRMRLAVGRHVFVATGPGAVSRVVNVDVRAGEDARVSFEPPPEPPVAPAPTPAAPLGPPPRRRPEHVFPPKAGRPAPARDAGSDGTAATLRAIGVGALALGAAGVVTGVVFGVEAIHHNDQSYDDGHCDRNTCDGVGLPLRSAAVRDGHWSTAFLLAGAASTGLGLGAYFYFAPRSERVQTKASPAAIVPRRLRLTATGGLGAAGLAADLSF